MRLMPLYINQSYGRSDFDECERPNVSDCIECGCCAYVCPSRIPLVQVMKSKGTASRQKKSRQALTRTTGKWRVKAWTSIR